MIYAGFWRRFAAHLIDWTLISTVLWIVVLPAGFVIGGAMVGQDLIKAAERRKTEQMKPHTEMQVIQKIVPLANAMTMAQAAPAEQPLSYSTQTPEVTAPAASATVPAPQVAPTGTAQAHSIEDMHHADSDDEKFDMLGTILGLIVNGVFSVLMWGIGIAYHTYFIGSKWQATPGKRVMNCCVVSRDGKPLDYGHAFARHIACFLSWLPFPPLCIGFFLAGWTREKTALHDMIAATRVVRTVASLPVIATH